MSQDPFEGELRAMLARREAGSAPAALAWRIEAERATSSRGFRGLSTGLRWLASGAAAIVVVMALTIALGQRGTPVGPGASPAPSVVATPLRAGDGIADGTFVPVAQVALGLIVLGVLGRIAFRATSRPLAIASTLAAVGVVLVAGNIGRSDALAHDGGISGVVPPSSRQDDQPGTFLGVKGNEPFHVFLTITNRSRLPLELKGFSPTPVPADLPQLGPRFIALGMYPTSDSETINAPPFRPTRLEPGGSVDLVLLGMAGECAMPVPPTDRIGGGFTTLDSVQLVYEQLTLVHTQAVALGDRVNIWWPDTCSADNLPQ